MSEHNTGQIIGQTYVCEYSGRVVIQRRPTTRDLSLAMERAVLEKKTAEKAKAESDSKEDVR